MLLPLNAVAVRKLSLRDPLQSTSLLPSIKAVIKKEKPIKDYLTKSRQSELQFITS
ncbi:MAG: hypothetical protein Q7T48_07585 [Cellvibrio sp.]|uniref:hypothetical protein n=1 Tax=Cellvibrio sp. TaxID=1965322 RepID=UPI00271F46D1|nr:hypothetical protein [Cellvibrio sp.]